MENVDILELDLKKLFCPLPVLKLKQFVCNLPSGQKVNIVLSLSSLTDIRLFINANEHKLIQEKCVNDVCQCTIEIK